MRQPIVNEETCAEGADHLVLRPYRYDNRLKQLVSFAVQSNGLSGSAARRRNPTVSGEVFAEIYLASKQTEGYGLGVGQGGPVGSHTALDLLHK